MEAGIGGKGKPPWGYGAVSKQRKLAYNRGQEKGAERNPIETLETP